MKDNFKIAGILGAISLICALLIAGFYLITNPIINDNNAKKELETCKTIFPLYDADLSEEKEVSSDQITKKVLAKDADGNTLGYLYTVSGKNAYGTITLMVAINENNKVIRIEFLENGQSFASTVLSHAQQNYPSAEDDTIYPLIKPSVSVSVEELDSSALENIDVKCGATFGATLVKDLVTAALDDAKGGK